MAAEYLSSWKPSAIYASNSALLTLLDAAATAAKVTIHNSSDTLLATITLDDPSGTLNGTTGELTLTAATNGSVSASGTASYATLRDGDNTAYRSLPCSQGTSPLTGYCVISTLALSSGEPIQLVSFSVI